MRSADALTRRAPALAALLTLGLLAGGCTTTQQKSERAHVVATRLLESRKPLLVTDANPSVKVLRTTLVRGRGGSAIVVRLRNVSARPLEDLPISVGVRRPHRVLLNRRGGLDYLARHVPALAARADATWVFTTPRRLARHAAPFARVGVSTSTPPPSLPRVAVSQVAASGAAVSARLANSSDIPQYGLGVMSYATRRGRVVAAGRTVIRHLGTGSAATVRLVLAGSARDAVLHVDPAPSTLR